MAVANDLIDNPKDATSALSVRLPTDLTGSKTWRRIFFSKEMSQKKQLMTDKTQSKQLMRDQKQCKPLMSITTQSKHPTTDKTQSKQLMSVTTQRKQPTTDKTQSKPLMPVTTLSKQPTTDKTRSKQLLAAKAQSKTDACGVMTTETGHTNSLHDSNIIDSDEIRNNVSLNLVCQQTSSRDAEVCETISNVANTFTGLTPSVERSKHGQILRREFRIYETDPGVINNGDDNIPNTVPDKPKCLPKNDEQAAPGRFKHFRAEATRVFVSSALGASLTRAFLRFRGNSGQFAMNVRQAMRRSLVVKGFMHPNAVAVRTIHVHIGLVVFICVFELVIGAITVYRFIKKKKHRRFGHLASGLVLLVGRQLLTICFALVGGAIGQIILFGAPVAGAILGAVVGAAIGQIVGWLLSHILKKFLPRLIRHCARQFGYLPENNEERFMVEDSSTYSRHRPYECCLLSDFNCQKTNIY